MKKFFYAVFIIFAIISACSSENDKTLYDSAVKSIDEEKYELGITNFEKIISEFPESKYRPKVLFELGKMYQARLNKKTNEVDSYKNSKKYFSMLYKEFPKDKNAGSSIFMVAFIQANLLNQLDSAKVNYQKFISEFPNHSMVESAKAEISNLGVPPEEIINK